MKQPKNWKDKLALEERRGVYGIVWIVWDDLDGESEGATVGELRPDLHDSDPEYSAVHDAVEAFWKYHPACANCVRDGFWFESIIPARQALVIARRALVECRKLQGGKDEKE